MLSEDDLSIRLYIKQRRLMPIYKEMRTCPTKCLFSKQGRLVYPSDYLLGKTTCPPNCLFTSQTRMSTQLHIYVANSNVHPITYLLSNAVLWHPSAYLIGKERLFHPSAYLLNKDDFSTLIDYLLVKDDLST